MCMCGCMQNGGHNWRPKQALLPNFFSTATYRNAVRDSTCMSDLCYVNCVHKPGTGFVFYNLFYASPFLPSPSLLSVSSLSSLPLPSPTQSTLAAQLYAEISQLNLNLPARVCVPLYGSRHQVLRIPGSEAVVLNSKSKVRIPSAVCLFTAVYNSSHTCHSTVI